MTIRRPWRRVRATQGSGNVFADAGLPDADERQVKADLARHIRALIADRGLTQTQAADVLGVDQPKISALMRGLLTGFSLERLMRFVTALDRSIEVIVMPEQSDDLPARIAVDTLVGFLERAADAPWGLPYRDFPNVYTHAMPGVIDGVTSTMPSANFALPHFSPLDHYVGGSTFIATHGAVSIGPADYTTAGEFASSGFHPFWRGAADAQVYIEQWSQQRQVIDASSSGVKEILADSPAMEERRSSAPLRVAA